MYKILIAIALLHIAYVSCVSPDLVIVMARHGARAPVDATYDTAGYWTGQYGALTAYGNRMAYILGSAYVADYPNLLLPYSSKTVYARSTYVDRTMKTAQSFMQGVYNGSGTLLGTAFDTQLTMPPHTDAEVQAVKARLANNPKFASSVPSVPISLVNQSSYDKVLDGLSSTCSSLSDTWSSQNDDNNDSYGFYTKYTLTLRNYLKTQGISITSTDGLYYFGDVAIANRYMGYPIPGNITYNSQNYQDAKFFARWFMTNWYAGQAQQNQLGSVYFLQNVITTMNQVNQGNSSYKFVYYSSHDTTMLPILGALGLISPSCLLSNYLAQKAGTTIPYPYCLYPGFTSNLRFEFYKNNGNPFVLAYYDGGIIPICNGAYQCSLSGFVSYVGSVTNNYSTADFDRLCGQ